MSSSDKLQRSCILGAVEKQTLTIDLTCEVSESAAPSDVAHTRTHTLVVMKILDRGTPDAVIASATFGWLK